MVDNPSDERLYFLLTLIGDENIIYFHSVWIKANSWTKQHSQGGTSAAVQHSWVFLGVDGFPRRTMLSDSLVCMWQAKLAPSFGVDSETNAIHSPRGKRGLQGITWGKWAPSQTWQPLCAGTPLAVRYLKNLQSQTYLLVGGQKDKTGSMQNFIFTILFLYLVLCLSNTRRYLINICWQNLGMDWLWN